MPPPDDGQLCAGGSSAATGDMSTRHAMAVGVGVGWARGEIGAEICVEIGVEIGAGWASGEIRRRGKDAEPATTMAAAPAPAAEPAAAEADARDGDMAAEAARRAPRSMFT